MEVDRRKTREENKPPTSTSSSSNDANFEMMMKTMEILMDMLDLYNIPPNREHPEPQVRNPNFRRPPPSQQNRKRDPRNPRNPEDQQIRPPFSENYVDDEEETDPMYN